MSEYLYPWPASAIGREEMSLLYLARESSTDKTSITKLIATAVRAQYGHLAAQPEQVAQPEYKTRLPAA